MTDFWHRSIAAARLPHCCDWCREEIPKGSSYKRYRWVDGGDAWTVKMHPECLAACNDEAHDLGEEVWFIEPYVRGTRLLKSDTPCCTEKPAT